MYNFKTHPKEYHALRNAIYRCTNPRYKSYKNYGARGITVCQQWIDSFDQFILDVGACPLPNLTLDRIDNDKGYEPGNCRWVTMSVQIQNRDHPSWSDTAKKTLRKPKSKFKSTNTGIKGIRLTSAGKYVTRCCINNTQYHLGTFDTLEEAKAAYEKGIADNSQ